MAFTYRPLSSLFSLALVLAAIGLASRPATCEKKAPADPVARAVHSTVYLKSGSLYSAAFCVAPKLFATCAHGLAPGQPLELETSGGLSTPGKVVARSSSSDLVLLSADLPLHPLDLAAGRPHCGDRVWVVGHRGQYRWTVGSGVLSSPRRQAKIGPFDRQDWVQFDCQIDRGDSGGPVVDVHGRVVGLVAGYHAVFRGVSFAVPPSEIRTLLEEYRVRVQG